MSNVEQLSDSRMRIRLVSSRSDDKNLSALFTWSDAVGTVIQKAISFCHSRSSGDSNVLEGLFYLRAIDDVIHERRHDGAELSPELALFTNIVGFYEFRLQDRRYSSIDHPVGDPDQNGRRARERNGVAEQVIHRLASVLEGATRELGSRPASEELISVLLAHLTGRKSVAQMMEGMKTDEDSAEAAGVLVDRVHSSRRSAIMNWLTRLETWYREQHRHGEAEPSTFAYPYCDIVILDGEYVLVLLVSPLDDTFVDDKVKKDHRVGGVTLGVYKVTDALYPGVVEACRPMFCEGFGRVLFTIANARNSNALVASFGDLQTISRNWYVRASDGLAGILTQEELAHGFDALTFAESLVDTMLCKVEGVQDTEVYPFDRAYLFREAGTSTDIDEERPMEVVVLEASILSNNPADRGQSLTRRERNLRGTEDFECNAAQKTIEPQNRYRFFLHGHDEGIILTCKPKLDTADKKVAFEVSGRSRSRDGSEAQTRSYGIRIPKQRGEAGLALRNLLGRLIFSSHQDKETRYVAEDGKSTVVIKTRTFSDDFMKLHLKVLQQAGADGLYFDFKHGLDLPTERPLFHRLQSAYFDYLADRYQLDDQRLETGRLLEDNLTREEAQRVLAAKLRNRVETAPVRLEIDDDDEMVETEAVQGNTKVVFISFSSDLHDENIKRQREDEQQVRKTSRNTQVEPILGPEYTFTIILVADQEPEKARPQLQREREDLQTALKMLIRQVWMDKLTERKYLEQRSQSISASLEQFLHRAKGLVRDDKAKMEIDDLFGGLKSIVRPERAKVSDATIETDADLLFRVISDRRIGGSVDAAVQRDLVEKARQWCPKVFSAEGGGRIIHVTCGLPKVQIPWSDAVIRDAFYVLLKNACEAAAAASGENAPAEVSVKVELVPLVVGEDTSTGYVQIVVENTGGPIPMETLAKLNAANPTPVARNSRKDGSTGLGLFLSRFQLRSTIGQGADIVVNNTTGGRVQSRLRLPATILGLAEAVREMKEPVDKAPDRYVLYVEDDPEFYDETLPRLQDLFSPSGIQVRHARGCRRAIDLVRQRVPILVLSDLFITKSESAAEPAEQRHGLTFLKEVMTLGEAEGDGASAPRVPIWLLTAEETKGILEGLKDAPACGYRILAWSAIEPRARLEPGTICITGFKKPFEVPGFREGLSLLQPLAAGAAEDPVPAAAEDSPVPSDHVVRRVGLGSRAFESRLKEVVAELGSALTQLVVVESAANSIEELAGSLAKWFSHPGLPDPEGEQDRDLYRLSNHVFHRRMVLTIGVDRELFDTLPPSFVYWGLSRNVWMREGAVSDRRAWATWNALRQEAKGPLSVLRHDVRNRWHSPVLAAQVETVLGEANHCESLLSVSEPFLQELQDVLARNGDASRLLSGLRQDPGHLFEARKRVGQHLARLENALQRGAQERPGLSASVLPQVRMIESLRGILRGEA